MSRLPQEVFSDHLAALAKRDVPLILEDYAEDARIITPQGALEGLTGVEAFYTQALAGLPDLEVTITSRSSGRMRCWLAGPQPQLLARSISQHSARVVVHVVL